MKALSKKASVFHILVSSSVGGWFSSITRGIDDDKMSAELKMFDKMKKEAEKLEKSSLNSVPTSSSNGLEDSIDQTGITSVCLKESSYRSVTMNIFRKFFFSF